MQDIFERLKAILSVYAKELVVVHNKEGHYYLDTHPSEVNPKGDFFAATTIRKKYVSYYLMPVYCNPDLLLDISPELKKRMQGKSCFNFKSIDETLFKELEGLTALGFEDYKKDHKVATT